MIYISMSLIRDLLDCPKKLDFRIGKGIEQEPTREMAEGSIVHTVLEKAWHDQELAKTVLREELVNYKTRLDLKKINTCIENFFLMYGPVLKPEDDIEKVFKVPYKKDITFVGKFDRIHNNVLFDWKTGNLPPPDMNKDVQFMVYYLAYKRLYNREPSAMIYVHLQSRRNYIFTPSESYLEEFESELMPYIISEVKKRDKLRLGLIKYGMCPKCTFRKACLKDE